jgi:hypothetical protein
MEELEGALAGLAGFEFPNWDGLARIMVVVAEILLAQADTAATLAVGEDVAALKAGLVVRLDAGVGRGHMVSSPHRGFLVKLAEHWA